MKVSTVGEYGVQMTRLGLVNCYLVRESDGWTVIDANLPGRAVEIVATATDRGLSIRRLLLTHAHQDHVGSVDELATLVGGLELAISEREVPLLRQPPDLATRPGELAQKLTGGFPGVKTAPTHTIKADELYGSLRCLPTPGHTPGHFSFLDERDGTLYVGDAIVTFGGKPRIAGFVTGLAAIVNRFTWDKRLARSSVESLRGPQGGVAIRRLCSGHGRVTEGDGLIEQALAHA